MIVINALLERATDWSRSSSSKKSVMNEAVTDGVVHTRTLLAPQTGASTDSADAVVRGGLQRQASHGGLQWQESRKFKVSRKSVYSLTRDEVRDLWETSGMPGVMKIDDFWEEYGGTGSVVDKQSLSKRFIPNLSCFQTFCVAQCHHGRRVRFQNIWKVRLGNIIWSRGDIVLIFPVIASIAPDCTTTALHQGQTRATREAARAPLLKL